MCNDTYAKNLQISKPKWLAKHLAKRAKSLVTEDLIMLNGLSH